MKTEEQKKTLQAEVSDKNGEKCVMNCRIYLIEKGIEKRCMILQKGKKRKSAMNLLSPESLGEQIYRNNLITVCLFLSWLRTKGRNGAT